MTRDYLFPIWVLLLVMVSINFVGCVQRGVIKTRAVIERHNGDIERTETIIRAPKDPKAASLYGSGTNGVTARISGSQSKAEIEKVKGANRNKMFLYGGCALLLLIGGVALALPNHFVSNKDALLVIGSGIACAAAVVWVESASGVMAYVLPALIVAACVYVGWLFYHGKLTGKKP